jgi:hypothetical protein
MLLIFRCFLNWIASMSLNFVITLGGCLVCEAMFNMTHFNAIFLDGGWLLQPI